MNEYFPHLFEPIKIGKTTVKNRIFMPPISTNMADKGYVTDALVEHYSARAKGGSRTDCYRSYDCRASIYIFTGRYVYL